MAHFAEISDDGTVLRVIVVSNDVITDEDGVEQEQLGKDFCQNLLGGTWVQTSYNGTIRKNFAATGYTYDAARDAFIPPQPYSSWVLNNTTCNWEAPVTQPDDGNMYIWNESTLSWDGVDDGA